MIDLRIEPKGERGRVFTGHCAAFLTANHLFAEGAVGVCIRPAWAVFVGSDQEIRPFVTNLRLGRRAQRGFKDTPEERIEFLRSERFALDYQREREGTIATLYHPEIFRLDPGMIDPVSVGFVAIVPEDWAAAQHVDPTEPLKHVARCMHPSKHWPDFDELARMVPSACLFAAYLDNRTRCPIIPDPRFHLQILIAALDAKFASMPLEWSKYYAYDREGWANNASFAHKGIGDVGVRHAIAAHGKQADVEAFLAEQTAIYFRATKGSN